MKSVTIFNILYYIIMKFCVFSLYTGRSRSCLTVVEVNGKTRPFLLLILFPNTESQKTLTIPDYPEIGALSILVSVNPQSSVPPPFAAVMNRATKSVLCYVVCKIECDTSKRLTCERWHNYLRVCQ